LSTENKEMIVVYIFLK